MTGIPNHGLTFPVSDVTRPARLAHERKMLDEAREELSSGHGVDDDDLEAWLDAGVAGEPVDGPEASPTDRPR